MHPDTPETRKKLRKAWRIIAANGVKRGFPLAAVLDTMAEVALSASIELNGDVLMARRLLRAAERILARQARREASARAMAEAATATKN